MTTPAQPGPASTTAAERVAPLNTPGGHFAMVALDQRESMRAMFAKTPDGQWVGDDALRAFKLTALRVLSPHATGILLDRPYALDRGRPAELADGCALIVAADVLHQPTGGGITNVTFDELVTPAFLNDLGANAIKFLVVYRPDSGADDRRELVSRAVDLAQKAGVASLIEGVVQPPVGAQWADQAERHAAILDAARELSVFGPDVYKAEVPGYVPGDVSAVRQNAEQMSEIVGGNWVVLSNGVDRPDFADALTEARLGGAAGFLAGRAIWADTVPMQDHAAALEQYSVPRITALASLVDTVGADIPASA